MNATAADDLAHRICATWQRTAPVTEWADALADLDETTARGAFRRWRNEHREAPTIADIRAMAQAADQRRHVEVVTSPEPLDVTDEGIVARMRAVAAIIDGIKPEAAHRRDLVGRTWQHSPRCERCAEIEARFWDQVGGRDFGRLR